MSYQQDIRKVLATQMHQGGREVPFDVTLARPGSFEMKVVLLDRSPADEQTFDLSNGLTPRIQRQILGWFASVRPGATPADPITGKDTPAV